MEIKNRGGSIDHNYKAEYIKYIQEEPNERKVYPHTQIWEIENHALTKKVDKLMNQIENLNGLKVIIQSPNKVKVKRSWKERLFTLPWTPLISHSIELREILKFDQIIKTSNGLIMNEATFEEFKRKIEMRE